MMRNTTLCTAMHEAGHAVAQLANQPAPWIDSVEVFGPGRDLLGIVNTESMWQPAMAEMRAAPEIVEGWRGLAWKDILFYLAGPVAELKWRRWSRAGIALAADTMATDCLGELAPDPNSDLGRVRARLRWAYPGEEREAFVRAWLEADETISRHWRAVRAIGRLLQQRGRLSDVELRDAWQAQR